MKGFKIAAALVAVCGFVFFSACGGIVTKVQYTLACTATCPSTSTSAAVALVACDVDGQDPNTIAQNNVNACVAGAVDGGCADATCTCQATRTATVCTN